MQPGFARFLMSTSLLSIALVECPPRSIHKFHATPQIQFADITGQTFRELEQKYGSPSRYAIGSSHFRMNSIGNSYGDSLIWVLYFDGSSMGPYIAEGKRRPRSSSNKYRLVRKSPWGPYRLRAWFKDGLVANWEVTRLPRSFQTLRPQTR